MPSWAQIPQLDSNLADSEDDDGEDVAPRDEPKNPEPLEKEKKGAQGKIYRNVTKKWKSRGCCAARLLRVHFDFPSLFSQRKGLSNGKSLAAFWLLHS